MGAAMAHRFALEGAAIAVVDIDAEAASRVSADVNARGGTSIAVTADVAASADVSSAINTTRAELGDIDVLCSNAGILDGYATVLETSEDLWNKVMAVNLTGMYLMARAVLPSMIESGRGVVINTASIAGLVAGGGGAAYTAAKHGVIGLTRQISFDFGPMGVRANAICPGAVESSMTRDLFADGRAAVMDAVRSVPAGRTAQPEEIAELALFLASDESSFMHGAAVVIDGGWTIR